jgi:hypothetical protein
MDETSLDDLRAELVSLEAAEAKISAERRHLHDQIDYGFATDATRAREREVSDERRRLHQRIDSLRELLGEDNPVAGRDSATPEPPRSSLSEWSGISAEVAARDDASSDESEL